MDRLIIDIGTHEAQELRVLGGDRCYVFRTYCYWWYDWFKRQIKKLIRYNGLIKYGTGAYSNSPTSFSAKDHLRIIWQFLSPVNYLSSDEVIAVDPAISVTSPYLERVNANRVVFLPIAILPHDDKRDCGLVTFYNQKNSLSSSLSPSENCISTSMSVALSFQKIIAEIGSNGFFKNSQDVVIRMNCEGAELAIIQSLLNEKIYPKIILGSVNDILKKYGKEEADLALSLLQKHKIIFQYFKGSDPSTWIAAFDIFS